MNKRIIFFLVSIIILTACDRYTDVSVVSSPSGSLRLEAYLTGEGQPAYKLYSGDQLIIDQSLLGFELKQMPALATGFAIVDTELSTFDNTWEQPWGEQRLVRNHYRQLRVGLKEIAQPGRRLDLVFRVYNNGLAFRYSFPEQPSLTDFEITGELTEFNLTDDHTAWWTPAQAGNQYEYLYRKTPVSEMELVHTPLTMKTSEGRYISIHEAALYDYSTMNLKVTGEHGLRAELVPWSPATDVRVKAKTPFVTPWRTVQVVDDVGGLVESYLTLNLNEPNKLGDVGWVEPGKYVGVWWELHLEKATWKQGPNHGATTGNVKKYIDFAAKHGFDGVLVEGWNRGWDGEWWNHGGGAFSFTEPYPDYDVDELAAYAEQKGVYLIGHHETGADTENYERQMKAAFDFLQEHGMKAVKTGYVETGELLTNGNYHQGQSFVRHHYKVIETAAEHKVMVVAHETIKDTGERRTYPNMVSREVARGQEYDAWSEDGGNPPSHTTILPFTRMLAGPMDFTPGAFELTLPDKPNNQVNTTLAKQLALYVVIYSPVQMASDLPENYEKHLDAFQFIKDVPVDWETTRFLAGEIGQYVALARQERQGPDWFIGAITNEDARDVTLELSFLEPGKTYQARIYKDGHDTHYATNPASYVIEEKRVTAQDTLNVHLAAGGGVAVSLLAE